MPIAERCSPHYAICLLSYFITLYCKRLAKGTMTLNKVHQGEVTITVFLVIFAYKKFQFQNPKTDFSLTSANKPQSSLDLYLQV